MIRIFIGNTTLVLSSKSAFAGPGGAGFASILSDGLNDFLKNSYSREEKTVLHIITSSPEESLKVLRQKLVYISAGGGLVQNTSGEILFIFRHNKWDLPKGKPEGKESKKQTALREVEEECGVSGLEILGPLPSTWHLYPLDEQQFAIKQSTWFHMRTAKGAKLTAQTNEGITEARWIAMPVPSFVLDNAFLSIRYLVDYFQKQRLALG